MMRVHSVNQRMFWFHPKASAGITTRHAAILPSAATTTVQRRFHKKYTTKITGVTLMAAAARPPADRRRCRPPGSHPCTGRGRPRAAPGRAGWSGPPACPQSPAATSRPITRPPLCLPPPPGARDGGIANAKKKREGGGFKKTHPPWGFGRERAKEGANKQRLGGGGAREPYRRSRHRLKQTRAQTASSIGSRWLAKPPACLETAGAVVLLSGDDEREEGRNRQSPPGSGGSFERAGRHRPRLKGRLNAQTSSTSTPARSAFAAAMILVCRCDGTSS